MSTSVFAVSFSPAIAQALGIESDPNCIPLEIFFAIPTYLVASLFYPMNRVEPISERSIRFPRRQPLPCTRNRNLRSIIRYTIQCYTLHEGRTLVLINPSANVLLGQKNGGRTFWSPCCGLFLTARVLLHLWNSMLIKIWSI
jgi:hypothetical protein